MINKTFLNLFCEYVDENDSEELIEAVKAQLDISVPSNEIKSNLLADVYAQIDAEIIAVTIDRMLEMLLLKNEVFTNDKAIIGFYNHQIGFYNHQRLTPELQCLLYKKQAIIEMEAIPTWDALDFQAEMDCPKPFGKYSERKLDSFLKHYDRLPKPEAWRKGMMMEVLGASCFPQLVSKDLLVKSVFSTTVCIEDFAYSVENLPFMAWNKAGKRMLFLTLYCLYINLKLFKCKLLEEEKNGG